VNRRALGCAVIGVVVFLGVGAFGLSRALAPPGCPERLQYVAQAYLPEGAPLSSPDAELVQIGSTFIGLTTRAVYAEAGSSPSGSGEPPDRFVLDCADGTFQAFVRAEASGS
jgi:hypothetical protein